MFKKELGISIYPEKVSWEDTANYLKKAKKYGFTKVFMSWLQISNHNTQDKYLEIYKKAIKRAKELGFYIVLDINNNNFDFYQSLGVDCIRLDTPAWPQEVAEYSYQTNLDIQINLSGNDSYVDMLVEWDPVMENIYGCHNFYPLLNTGLGIDCFKESTKKFNKYGIHCSAFINSLVGKDAAHKGLLNYGASTLESTRLLPIKSQAKHLFATKQIDCLYIANQFASDEELKSLSELNLKETELDIEINTNITDLEVEMITKPLHCYRADSSNKFIRISWNRVIFKDNEYCKVDAKNSRYHTGDILIFNKNADQYEKELIIVTDDNVYIENGNLVGKIKEYDLKILALLKPRQHFKLKIIE